MVSTAPAVAEDVILSSPMSFTGSARRIMRLRPPQTAHPALRILATIALVCLVASAWSIIACWYAVMYTFWLVPTLIWRFHRRGVRRERAQNLRHRELIAAVTHDNDEAVR